jgi:hypothetical protein
MHSAARDWSASKYGKPIGNDASAGCWQAMVSASPSPVSLEEIVEVLGALCANLERILYRDIVGLRASATPQFERVMSLLSRLKEMEGGDSALSRARGETP